MKTIVLSALLILGFLKISTAQTPDANKQVARRYFEEVINKQKVELLGDLFAKDYVYYDLSSFTETKGIEPLQAVLPQFFKAFPDTRYTVESLLAEGDKVCAQITFTGTHKAEFMGIPASNNKIKITEIYYFTVKNDKVVESRRLVDFYSFFKQISSK